MISDEVRHIINPTCFTSDQNKSRLLSYLKSIQSNVNICIHTLYS